MKKKSFYQLIQHETQRREEIENDLMIRLRQQEVIAGFGEFSIKSKDLNSIINESVSIVTQTLDVELCKVLQLMPDGNEMLLRAGLGWNDGLVGHAMINAGPHTQAGLALHTSKALIVSDLRKEGNLHESTLLLDHGVVSGMSAVIQGRDRPWGVLGVHSRNPKKFTEYDTRFLVSVANILASAIERFHTEDELRRSRDELEIILDGISEGVTAQDPNGKILFSNRAALQILGYPDVHALYETPVRDVVKNFQMKNEEGKVIPVTELPGRQVFVKKKECTMKLRFRSTLNGAEEWAIVGSTPVFDETGNVTLAVNIFRIITDLVWKDEAQKVLAEAGKLFAETLQYENTMQALANMVIQRLADWCTVHLVTDDRQIKQLVVTHKDPSKISMALELQKKYPPDWESDGGLVRVLRTGEPQFYPEITDKMLRVTARDETELEFLRKLEMHSAVIVPLIARKQILGAISLIRSESSGGKFNQDEINLIQELANRAAIAIENVKLYQEASQLNTNLENRVALRTRQLEQANKLLITEIEERRKAEAAQRRSQSMLQTMFESSPDATILIDATGAILESNKQAEVMFGYPAEELVGQRIELLIPKRFQNRHIENRALYSIESGTRQMGSGLELFACRKSGEEFPVDILLSPIYMDTGTLVLSSIRDITEQKRLQTELAETHRRLFESVEAERKMLSQDLHDGPLQDLYGVALLLEGVRSNLEDSADVRDLDDCRNSVQAVAQTLRSICGNLRPPALSHFGLSKAIHSHLVKFQETHPGIEIDARIEDDGNLLSDRARLALYRVYQNSLNNIIRHAQAKNVRIDLHVNNENLIFSISDDGKGFRVPRRWVELAREGHFGLVGMVERVEAIGGHLSVVSNVGEGTTIEVNVPLEPASQ
jgi:PAS domain S-box-containing protein